MKRLLDVVLSAAAIVIVTPVALLVALAVRFSLGSPVLFVQKRPGQYERPFLMYKFRTMLHAKDENGELLEDRERLTRLGRFLRSTSLDELPELWNVLKGDMSLVGPRPLLMEYLPLYSARQRRRHEVRPGITGLAQVSGRNALGWEDRLEIDVWYVENRTLWLDLKILLLTFWKVIKREGISAKGEATMSRFTGKKGE